MKKDAAIATNGIITFGTEAQPIIESLSKDEQNQLFQETANRIANRLNTDLTGLVVHRDEAAIHAHFQMLAVNKDGLPLSKVIDRKTAKELQDIAGQVYAAHGITRGTPKAERLARGDDLSKIVHRSVAELHRDLPTEIEAKRKALEAQRLELQELEAKAEKNRRLAEEQAAKLQAGRVAEEAAAKRTETYLKREADAKAKAERIAREIAEKEAEVKRLADMADSAEQRRKEIDRDLGLIDKPRPNLPAPVTVKVSDGLLKSHEEQFYRPRDVQDFSQALNDWARGAATKSIQQKATIAEWKEKGLAQKEKGLAQRESDIAQREQSIESREKRMNELETQNKRLLDERSLIGTHIGHILGVENASMNMGKIVDAIVKTGDLAKFREILRENRVQMKGQGKSIGA